MKRENVKKTWYLRPSTAEMIEVLFREDNCGTQSEFVEKALLYYIGYLKAEKNMDYLSPTIMSSMRAVSEEGITRITRMLFKLAVETAVMNNLIAATVQFDPEQYNTLRRESERMVRKTNGDFGMTDALKWQQKMDMD